MIKFSPIILILMLLIVSCAGTPAGKKTEMPEKPEITEKTGKPETPEKPEISEIPEKPKDGAFIMGKGTLTAEDLSLFLLGNNPQIDADYIKALSYIYIEEAAHEGVNHDIAFAQMCLETGFLKFGGLVQPEWYNFCGLGAIGPEQPGLIFPDPRIGVRAHIQHLKAYATDEPLKLDLVDPRYKYVRLGSSPTIDGLAGTWAADRQYAIKIQDILQRLYEFSFYF